MNTIKICDITKEYDNHTVLDKLSFSMEAGEICAISGASGTGKSTLLNITGLLDRPDSGSVFINDTETTNLPFSQKAKLRATSIGFIFQGFQLLPEFSVLENILMPARCAKVKVDKQAAYDLLDKTKLLNRKDDSVQILSGGERQRIAICRALLLKPKIILADEPTGNLDPKTGNEILDILIEMTKEFNSSVLLVTHDKEIAKRADYQKHLENGKLL